MEMTLNHRFQKVTQSDFARDFIKNGWKPYFVGGCVRDFIMGKPFNDIDFVVVGCEMDELITVLEKYGKPDLVGESFSVIKFKYDNEVYDVAIPRIERKIGEGHKGFEVISHKGITLKDDLMRRDITINSIALSFNGEIVDPFNGSDDIKNGIIKVTNEKAFIEDPLRILRIFRFLCRFDYKINSTTSQLIWENKKSINELSPERIWEEFDKAIKQSTHFQFYLDLITKYNLWDIIFPNIEIEPYVLPTKNVVLVMAYLFMRNHNTDVLVKTMVNNFKMPSKLANKVRFLIDIYDELDPNMVLKYYKKKIQVGLDNETLKKWFIANGLNIGIHAKFLKYVPSIKALDVVTDLGLNPKNPADGKRLGEEIRKRETALFLSL